MKKSSLFACVALVVSCVSAIAANPTLLNPFFTFMTPEGVLMKIRLPTGVAPQPPVGTPTGNTDMPPTTEFPINGKALMQPRAGFNALRIKATTDFGAPSTGGDFRITCPISHMLFDDPIVYPGRPNASHLHGFFGNSDVSGNDTAETLGNLSEHGRSTCAGGIANRSAYWIPMPVDVRTGFPIKPAINVVYYKNTSAYRDAHITEVTVPVKGLRMIAGVATSTSPQPEGVMRWQCFDAAANATSPASRSIPTGPGECVNGGDLMLLVFFMQCWDGVHLDSPNHASHMAYEDFYTGCPSTHPVMIPQISYNIHWKVDANNRPENWRLSSDRYSVTQPAGYSAHGDWIHGWDMTVLTDLVNGCLRAAKDCHANLLGDGRTLY